MLQVKRTIQSVAIRLTGATQRATITISTSQHPTRLTYLLVTHHFATDSCSTSIRQHAQPTTTPPVHHRAADSITTSAVQHYHHHDHHRGTGAVRRIINQHCDNETGAGEGGKFVTFPPCSGRKFGQLFLPKTLHDQHIRHDLHCSNTPSTTQSIDIIMCILFIRSAIRESASTRSRVPTVTATTRREQKNHDRSGLGYGSSRRLKLDEPLTTTDASQHPA